MFPPLCASGPSARGHGPFPLALAYASCTDCCNMMCWSYVYIWSVVVVVVACMLLLHRYLVLMLTLTFAPCACGVSTGANIHLHMWWFSPVATGTGCFFIQPWPLAQIVHLHTWWYHPLQLALVVLFIQPLAQILHLHSGNLHCVVVVCGGIYIIIIILFKKIYNIFAKLDATGLGYLAPHWAIIEKCLTNDCQKKLLCIEAAHDIYAMTSGCSLHITCLLINFQYSHAL